MKVYVGIDLHSNNCYVVVISETERVLCEKKLRNDLSSILSELEPYRKRTAGVVVESTFNWYWLVDGLMGAGYRVHLANTAKMEQYNGLKHSDDRSDARWLAEMLRLKVLPEGHIYPKEERAVRDLLRKRTQLVRQKTAHILSIQGLVRRHTAISLEKNAIRTLSGWDLGRLLPDEMAVRAAQSNLRVLRCLEKEVRDIEEILLSHVQARPEWENLLSVYGVGKVLGLTILLEAGDMDRFASAGHFASYCRCVGSEKLSNGKKKGKGNTKNGNKWLAWAFIEAASRAVAHYERAKRFYQRKKARTKAVVAMKAVAHKLARACYYVLKDGVPFQGERAFA